jgi:thiamine biosynthesis lipoprotein
MARSPTRRNFLSFDLGDRRNAADRWIRAHRIAMACRFEVMLSCEDAPDMAAAQLALDEADALEALLTIFRDTSALADLNRRAASEAVEIDGHLLALLSRCAELHAQTEGAFDVTASPLRRCWDVVKREGRLPTDAAIDEARATIGMRHVRLDTKTRRVRFACSGIELNFGAIGKGYALDRMREILRTEGTRRALLSAGRSSVLALGGRGRGWPVDLRPRLASRRVGRLWIRDGAVGTNGAGEQFVEIDGERYGHVVDPRNGRLAQGVLGASVITSDGASADALSTAFLVGGSELARRYCVTHSDVLAVLVLDEPGEPTEVFGRYKGATLEMLTQT